MRLSALAHLWAVLSVFVALSPLLLCLGQPDPVAYYQRSFFTNGGVIGLVQSIAISPTTGDIVIADSDHNRVLLLYNNGTQRPVLSVADTSTTGPVGVDGRGLIYIMDQSTRFQVLYPNGTRKLAFFATLRATYALAAVAVDAAGLIYVATQLYDGVTNPKGVQVLNATGSQTAFLNNSANGGFVSVVGVAVDAASNVYATDSARGLLVVLNSAGRQLFNVSGLGTPRGVIVDAGGNIFVTDTNANRVVVLYSNGTQKQVISGFGLNSIQDVAVDALRNVYIGGSRGVTVLSPVVPTYYQRAVYTVGTGSIALGGVAVDTAGDIFVTQNMSPGAVVVLFPNGTTKAVYTNAGYTNFTPPLEVAVDFTGQIVILDNTGRVFFLYPNGMQRVVYTSTSTYMLDFPYGVAVDGAGSAYVVAAIVNFNPIQAGVQVVNSSGALTAAYTNNGGFISPVAVAVDSVGNIHVVDNGLNQVVVLSSSGAQKQIIKPVDNFLQPSGIAIDSAGNIFVVDQGNGRVVVFYADGTQRQIISGLGFSQPVGIAVDRLGSLYITDGARVLLVSPVIPTYYQRSVYTGDGILFRVGGVAVNSTGFIFVTSITPSISLQVVVLYPNGTVAATFKNAFGSLSNDFFAGGVDVDTAGVVYVCDIFMQRLVLLNPNGTQKAVHAGGGALSPQADVAVDGQGNIYITGSINSVNGVVVLNSDGSVQTNLTSGLSSPYGVAVSPVSGRVYVTDTSAGRVVVLKLDNTVRATLAPIDGLTQPSGVAIDANGTTFVCDTYNSRLVLFNNDGTLQQIITGLGLQRPVDVAVDSSGTLYVADSARVLVLSTTPPAVSSSSAAPVSSSASVSSSAFSSSPTPSSSARSSSVAPSSSPAVSSSVFSSSALSSSAAPSSSAFSSSALSSSAPPSSSASPLSSTVSSSVASSSARSSSTPSSSPGPSSSPSVSSSAASSSAASSSAAPSSSVVSSSPSPSSSAVSSSASPSSSAVSSSASPSSFSPSFSSSSTAVAQAYGDPRLVGFWGQNQYVGGLHGEVYCMLLDSEAVVNARFVLLEAQDIHCPATLSTYCAAERGTYFQEVGVRAANGDRLEVRAGAAEVGFASVLFNGQPLTFVSGQSGGEVAEHRGHRPTLRGNDGQVTVADWKDESGISVQLQSNRSLSLSVGLYVIRLDVVDWYVDFVSVNTHCWRCLLDDVRPEGLLGRTWDATVEHRTDEEEVAKYRERDGRLLGCGFDLPLAPRPSTTCEEASAAAAEGVVGQ